MHWMSTQSRGLFPSVASAWQSPSLFSLWRQLAFQRLQLRSCTRCCTDACLLAAACTRQSWSTGPLCRLPWRLAPPSTAGQQVPRGWTCAGCGATDATPAAGAALAPGAPHLLLVPFTAPAELFAGVEGAQARPAEGSERTAVEDTQPDSATTASEEGGTLAALTTTCAASSAAARQSVQAGAWLKPVLCLQGHAGSQGSLRGSATRHAPARAAPLSERPQQVICHTPCGRLLLVQGQYLMPCCVLQPAGGATQTAAANKASAEALRQPAAEHCATWPAGRQGRCCLQHTQAALMTACHARQ